MEHVWTMWKKTLFKTAFQYGSVAHDYVSHK